MKTQVICPQMRPESILNEYGTQMLRFCTACLQSEQAGKEAMNRAFAELCRCAPKAPGEEAERIWLFTALFAACKAQNTARPTLLKEGFAKELAELRPVQRKIFLMRYYMGAGEGEIAAAMHLPKVLVRRCLAVAAEKLSQN